MMGTTSFNSKLPPMSFRGFEEIHCIADPEHAAVSGLGGQRAALRSGW